MTEITTHIEAAEAALMTTTVAYPVWKQRVDAGYYSNPSTTKWWQAFDHLIQAKALDVPPPPPPPPPAPVNTDGNVEFVLYTGKQTDYWTNNPTPAQQAAAQSCWDSAIVYASYWDINNKLSWFPNAWAYYDISALYVGSTGANEHPDWVLKDANGAFLTFFAANQFAADIGNPAYRAWVVDRLKAIAAKGYAGLFLDDVNLAPPKMSGNPINPRTGRLYLSSEWESDMTAFCEAIYVGIPQSKDIIHNSRWWDGGNGTSPNTKQANSLCDYFCLERGFLDKGYGVTSYSGLFNFIDRLHDIGVGVIHLNNTTYQTFEDMETNFAGALIGSRGYDYQWSNNAWQPEIFWSGYKTDLGPSLGDRVYNGGVYQRHFQNGSAYLADPITETTVVLRPDQTRLDGSRPASVAVKPRQGIVLLGNNQ